MSAIPAHTARAAARAVRLGATVLVTVLVAALPALLPGRAAADEPPVSRAGIYRSLGLDRESADYVILVDSSGSMAKGDLWDSAVATLRPFLQGMSPYDHVDLYTFDDSPHPKYSGPARPVDHILRQLGDGPTPRGATDIGAALEKALTRLERGGAAPVAAVVLLSDGRHQPSPGTRYPGIAGPAWDALKRRADTIAKGTDLSGFALPLSKDRSGAARLGEVVPGSTVLRPDGIGDLSGILDQAVDGVRARKAATLLAGDIGKGVTAAWTGPGRVGLSGGPVPGSITLTSADRHVPLRVTGLRAALEGTGTTVSGLPDTVDLAPGASRKLDVTVSGTLDGDLNPARHTRTEHPVLRVGGRVTSPWSAPLGPQTDLRIPGEVRTTGGTVPVSAAVGNALVLPVAAGGVLLVLLALWLRWRRVNRPRLRGELLLQPAFTEQIPDRVTLRGRRVTLAPRGVGGSGSVHGHRHRTDGRRQVDLLIQYTPDGSSTRSSGASCPPDGQVVINGVTFSYRAQPAGGVPHGTRR